MSRWIPVGVFAFFSLSANIDNARAATYYVPDNYPNIQTALAGVLTGDTIIVRDGTWTGDMNRDLQFFGKDVLLRSENGPEVCILDAGADELENHRVFNIQGGESRDAIIEGFTVTGGYMNGFASPANEGGGILVSEGSSPTIRDCIVESNTAKHGAGILVRGGSPYVTATIIRSNTSISSGAGGGVYLLNSSGALDDCEIRANAATMGGGLFVSTGQPNVSNCRILGNVAANSGGGVSWSAVGGNLRFSTISDNEAPHGGGLDMQASGFTTYKCTITGNRALGVLGTGGGIRFYDMDSSSLSYTIVWGNSSETPENGNQIAITGFRLYMRVPIDHSVVQGGFSDVYIPGDGSVLWGDYASSDNPQFCSSEPDTDEFWMLQSDSPCYTHVWGQIGAWASGCSTVPTLLQDFVAFEDGDGIRLTWSVNEPGVDEFELIGRRGAERWNVTYFAAGEGSFQALDHSAQARLGGRLSYELSYRSADGDWLSLGSTMVESTAPSLLPVTLTISPNPLNPGTVVRYSIKTDGRVRVDVLDLRGRRVATPFNSVQTAGEYRLPWDGRDDRGVALSSGVYVVRVTSPTGVEQRKLTLLK